MKLFFYEWYKIFCKKRIWVVLLGLLAVNIGVFYAQNLEESRRLLELRPYIQQLEDSCSAMDPQQAYEEMSVTYNELQALSIYQMYQNNDTMPPEQREEMISSWMEANPGVLEKYEGTFYLEDREKSDKVKMAYWYVEEQLAHIAGYPEFIRSMEEKARQMSQVSIFQKQGSFSYNNILKTPEDFAPLEQLPLKLGLQNGVVNATSFQLTDLLMLAVLFLCCIFLYLHEQDTGLIKLVRTSRRGHFPTIAAKTVSITVLSVLLALAFYGPILAVGQWMFGYGDLSRPIQSLQNVRDCTLMFTIRDYLGVYLLTKIGAACLSALVMSLFFVLFNSGKSIFVMLGVFIGGSALLYYLIQPASWLNIFKYVNLFAAFDVYNFYRLYININFFTVPLNRMQLCLWCGIAAGILFFVGTILCYMRQYTLSFVDHLLQRLAAAWYRWKQKRPLKGSVSLTAQEFRKVLITGKSWIVLAAALLLMISRMDTSPLLLYTVEDSAYKMYANRWSGLITQQTREEIAQEQSYLASIPQEQSRLYAQYKDGILSKEDYQSEYAKLQNDLVSLGEGFSMLESQYQKALALEAEGIAPAIVDTITADYLFDNEERDLQNGLIFLLLLILALSRVFPLDDEKGMAPILQCTLKGRRELVSAKLLVALAVSGAVWLTVFLPGYVTLFVKYNLALNAPIQNVTYFRWLSLPLTIGELLLLLGAGMALAGLCAAVWILLLSRIAVKQSFGILLSAVVLVVPFLATFLGMDILRRFTLVDALAPYQGIVSQGSWFFLYLAGMLAATIVGTVWLVRYRR